MRSDYVLVPTGILQRLVPRGSEAETPFERSTPMEPEDVRTRRRRERGQSILAGPQGIRVEPEAYEDRLFAALVKVRRGEADRLAKSAAPADLERATGLYAALRQVDPSSRSNRGLALAMIGCKVRLGRGAEEQELLEALIRSDPPPDQRAEGACLRGEILRSLGRGADAEQSFREALAVPGLDPARRADLERRAKGP
jgi:tetratricopeptide (TPR) repeat protein